MRPPKRRETREMEIFVEQEDLNGGDQQDQVVEELSSDHDGADGGGPAYSSIAA